MSRIYLSPPHLSGLEKDFLQEALDSNWIAPLGPQVDSFEEEIAKYLQIRLNAISDLSEKEWIVTHENQSLKIFLTIMNTHEFCYYLSSPIRVSWIKYIWNF